MSHFLFLDETGDHGLSYVDKNFPLFLLCGCVIEKGRLKEIEASVESFKKKYFGTTHVILHSRDIRKCEGSFQILFDLQLKEQFYKELNMILGRSDYVLIGSAIQKEKHIKKYGKGAKDPYSLSLSFIIERLIFYLDSLPEETSVKIIVEQRGKKEDQMLLSHFNSIMDRGTYYVGVDRLRERIAGFSSTISTRILPVCKSPICVRILWRDTYCIRRNPTYPLQS